MWLNVGAGDRHGGRPWIDCDVWPGTRPHVVMDAAGPWPFADGSADRVYMGQVVEHLEHPTGVRAALAEAARVAGTSGTVCVVCPDFAALPEKRCEAWIRENLERGECRWPGDEHRWCPDRHELYRLMCEFFAQVEPIHPGLIDHDWPPGNRDPWDCAVLATAA